MTDLSAWIGKQEEAQDVAAIAPLQGLAALLDLEEWPWSDGEVPPLGHWLYFLPRARQSEIDKDGHPKRGGFLPPVPLPRRMWAGGALEFLAPLPLGATIKRRSTIRDVKHKSGAGGELVFVTLEHEIGADGAVCIRERQDLVYRAPSGPMAAPPPPPPARPAAFERSVTADPVSLFRFSALTFNGHRIHYDRDYAREEEGYPGLVVHGPFTATLLMDLLRRRFPEARPASFSFRGVKPLIDGALFTLCLQEDGEQVELWCRDASGHETMTAKAVLKL